MNKAGLKHFLWTWIVLIHLIQGNTVNAQTGQGTKPDFSQIQKENFLKMAEESDSLKALVNLFYRKRKEAKTGYILSGVGFVVFPVIAAGSAMGTAASGGSDPTEELQAGAVIFSSAFMFALTASTVNMVKYSRSELFGIIQNYPTTGHIPDKYRKKLKPKDWGIGP